MVIRSAPQANRRHCRNLRLAITVAWLFLFTLPASAQLKVDGPDTVATCSGLVQLDATGADGPFDWVFLSPAGVDHRTLEDGAAVIFAAPAKPGAISIQCISWPAETFALHTITVGSGPTPDPDPQPDPPPDPAPTPMAEDFRVLILWESQDPAIDPVLTDGNFRRDLDAAAALGWRLYDDDYPDLTVELMHDAWQAAYRRAIADHGGDLPWLLITDGTNHDSQPLPETAEAAAKILDKY